MALELNQFLYIKGLRVRGWRDSPRWVQQLGAVRWYEYPTGDLSDLSDFMPINHNPSLMDTFYEPAADTLCKRVSKSKLNKGVFLRSDVKHLDSLGNFHHPTDPAYISGATELYYLNGVHISREFTHLLKLSTHDIDPKEILAIQHVDVRREFIRRIGIEQFLDGMFHRVIDTDGNYQLIQILLENSTFRPSTFLKMLNPSIGVWHLEGVPNECATVKDALLRRNNNWFAHADILT